MERWIAHGEYADGAEVKVAFPYTGYNTWSAECDAQHDIEAWLIEVVGEKHGGCEFYSVSYTDCFDPDWDSDVLEYHPRLEV